MGGEETENSSASAVGPSGDSCAVHMESPGDEESCGCPQRKEWWQISVFLHAVRKIVNGQRNKGSDHQVGDHVTYPSNQDPLGKKRGLLFFIPRGQNA